MSLNKIPNSACIDAFITKHGRAPECKNTDDVNAIADLIRHNHILAGDTHMMGWYWMPAARAAIIDYWKAKRLAKKA